MSDKDQAEPQTLIPDSGPDRDEMAAAFFPAEDEQQGKTILDINDPGRVAVLKQLTSLFPEIEEMEPVLDEFLDDFMQSRTSVQGKSRDEISDILISMYGGSPDGDRGSMVLKAVGADEDD